MNLRREQILLLATGLLVTFLGWSAREKTRRLTSTRSSKPPELGQYPVPDTALALPAADKNSALARDLFTPPRDTEPLALLELEAPPMEPMSALFPPPGPGLKPAAMGKFLRVTPVNQLVSDLFATDEDLGEEDPEEAQPGPNKPAETSGSAVAQDRTARVESYKKLFDWVRLNDGDPLFGRIESPDRYRLARRPKDPVVFVEVVPETGRERLPGQAGLILERARVTEFGFADTASNSLALAFAQLDKPLPPTQYQAALDLGERCLAARLEAREALELAAQTFQLAADTQDGKLSALPRLGLARVHEAAFEFDQALAAYETLQRDFPNDADVLASLGALEARFHMFATAQEHLREAAKLGRANWRVQLALGRFLLQRGEWQAAAEALTAAFTNEPSAPADKSVRAQIRSELGRAALALGDLDAAAAHYDRALQADERHAPAQAGRLAVKLCRQLAGGAASASAASGAPASSERAAAIGPAFDLVLNQALEQLRNQQFIAARNGLSVAMELDPLEAWRALRAQSYLAEVTGWSEEALRAAEEARDGNPTDAWTHFQLGRLYVQRGDDAAARSSFLAALTADADFPDALAWLGEISSRTRDFAAAERYFARALAFDEKRAQVQARRGWNLIEAGDVAQAAQCFERSLALAPAEPLAISGGAWLAYRGRDPAKAINILAELDDTRRALPESDPWRVWCQAQIERIQDHQTKVLWRDGFQRRELKREWEVEEGAGALVSIADGVVQLGGQFDSSGSVRLLRTYEPGDFVSITLTLTVDPASNAMVGLFLSKERRRAGGQKEVSSMVSVARRKDGELAVTTMDKASAEIPWTDVPAVGGAAWWPAGRPVRLGIEKIGQGGDAKGRIFVDGVPVAEGFRLSALSAPNMKLLVGVFAEGQTGLTCKVSVDDVEIVYRQPTKPR